MAGDGDWFWYARLANQGAGLYSTLHLPLQPLFPLETEIFQRIFGYGWIAGKIPAVINVGLYVSGLSVLINRSRWPYRQQGLVLIATFLFGIQFEAYRFDDYHVVSDSLFVFSAILAWRLLDLPNAAVKRSHLFCLALGAISALVAMTRLNDGAIDFAFCLTAVVLSAPRYRTSKTLLLFASFFATIAGVVALTGNSLVDWATDSVLHVGAIKGGSSTFLLDPLFVGFGSLRYAFSSGLLEILELGVIVVAWLALTNRFRTFRNDRLSWYARVASVLTLVVCAAFAFQQTQGQLINMAVLSTGIVVIFIVTGYAVSEAVRRSVQNAVAYDRRRVVLALPFLMLVSGSLSSAGSFADLYAPVAIFFATLPGQLPLRLSGVARSAFLTLLGCIGLCSIYYRTMDPASWISYRTFPLFVNRSIVDHPEYGPMIIDNKLLSFVDKVCPLVRNSNKPIELLSLPWPYVNYYCAIPPWHNYVQTWFDTTPRYVIYKLMDSLEVAPPEWIMYQRQPGTLAFHEFLFNNGNPLPQHDLDSYIMNRLATGAWKAEYVSTDPPDSTWYLIHTRFPEGSSWNLLVAPHVKAAKKLWAVKSDFPLWNVTTAASAINLDVVNRFNGRTSSSITSSVAFQKNGRIEVLAGISPRSMSQGDGNDDAGGTGITIDLLDEKTGHVVGKSAPVFGVLPSKTYGFYAEVDHRDPYALRVTYDAGLGSARISAPVILDQYAIDGRVDDACLKRATQITCRSSSSVHVGAWETSYRLPSWKYSRDGTIELTHAGVGDVVRSRFQRSLHFSRSGAVSVGVTIDSPVIDAASSYGYAMELFDETSDTAVGSLAGIPAIVSGPRDVNFVASVDSSDDYDLRLLFKGAAARVSFSNLRVEYGTQISKR